MKTMLFVVGPALGHVGRSLGIARAVVGSAPGTRVVFAHIEPGFGDRLLRQEFESVPIRYRDRGDEHFAGNLELAIGTVNPALIYLDLSPVPWLYLVRFPAIPRAYVTNFFLTSLVGTETFQVQHLRENFKQWNDRRRGRGLPELLDAKDLYNADAVLLCDPPGLVSAGLAIASPYHLVGPCIWEPAGSLPSRLSHARRLLLVALGSTGSRELPGAVVEKLRQALDCDSTVWVTGDNSAWKPPEHAQIYSGVPLQPILQKSALAITQGGAGSSYAALRQGVPVAVWPSHRNHEILGELLARKGAGAFVTELARLGPAEIRSKVESMEAVSRGLGRVSTGASGPASAAEILLSMT